MVQLLYHFCNYPTMFFSPTLTIKNTRSRQTKENDQEQTRGSGKLSQVKKRKENLFLPVKDSLLYVD